MTRPGQAVPKDKLFDQVFALDDDANLDAIEIYIHRLRKKLDNVSQGKVGIVTLRGIGYLLETR
jgi:two-component system response regulator TctD